MIRRSVDYIIWEKDSVDIMRAACYLASNPYGIVYVQDGGQIVGTITIGDVWRKLGRENSFYNTSFTWASTAEEAFDYINTRSNLHAIPVLDVNRRLIEQYQEDYIVPESFINGIRYKLRNFTGINVWDLLQEFQIKEIRLLQTQDSDKQLIELILEVLGKARLPIRSVTYEFFLEERNKKNDEGIIWIDTGENYLAQKVRRHIWTDFEKEYNPCTFYFYVKNFFNLLNNASESYNGYDRYFEDLLRRYKNVAIYGHSDKVQFFLEKYPELHNITDQVHLQLNSLKERYEISGPEENYGFLIALDWFQSVQFYYNNRFLPTDLYYLNCEHYVTRQYCRTILPVLEEKNVETFFMQLADVQSVLETAGIGTISDFRGNSGSYDPVHVIKGSEGEKDYREFLGYEDEVAEGFLMSPNPYLKTLTTGGLFYSCERNPVAQRLEQHRSIHIFGCCLINSVYDIDSDTVAALIKKAYPEWNVYAHGSLCVDLLETIQYYSEFQEGDIVLLMSTITVSLDPQILGKYTERVIEFSEAYRTFSDIFQRIWQTPLHCNHTVTKRIVRFILSQMECMGVDFKKYKRSGGNGCVEIPKGNEEIALITSNDNVQGYIDKLKMEADSTTDNGAVVMNCNPFTKGHRYLIETAAGQAERLFVFVVEEDKSFFPFQDRFEMVKRGCTDISNVTVLPSGRYVLSALTMPGYFEKEDLQDTVLDASTDLELFAYQIAPVLHIKKRFVGTEPTDRFTAQYNQEMKRILPDAGIELVEIERVKEGEQVVSASTVRKALREQRWADVKAMVPQSTWEYLRQNYNKNEIGEGGEAKI